mgnify:CR=1 FL=1
MQPIEVIIQKSTGDCGIAALAMILRLPYQQVCQVALTLDKQALNKGLHRTELVRIAEQLGYLTKFLRTFDPEEDEGIICLVPSTNRRGSGGHYVMLFNGCIVNPADGLVWPYEEYMKSRDDLASVGLLVVSRRTQSR